MLTVLKTTNSFSPLRYWGGLYLPFPAYIKLLLVLVPFDIGVVYIEKDGVANDNLSFSPLRYWGGLYHNTFLILESYIVLVPFDIGVVYINNEVGFDMISEF